MRRRAWSAVILALGLATMVGWWRYDRGDPAHPAASTAAGRAAGSSTVAEARRQAGEAPAPSMPGDDPPGEIRLEGQVIDADGRGAAGASVALSSTPARTVL